VVGAEALASGSRGKEAGSPFPGAREDAALPQPGRGEVPARDAL